MKLAVNGTAKAHITNLREGAIADFIIFDGADLRGARFTDSTINYGSFRDTDFQARRTTLARANCVQVEDVWLLVTCDL